MISGKRIKEAGKRVGLRIVPLLLVSFLMGCGDDADLPDRPDPEEETPVYLFFTVATDARGSSLRADTPNTSPGPTGGEEGDGREPGNSDEYAVKNLRIYLFPGNLTDLTGPTDLNTLKGVKVRTLRFGPGDLTETGHQPGRLERRYVTNTLRLTDLQEDTYNVLAVANVKDENADESEDLTLGALLERLDEGEPRDEQSHFRMSSEKLGKLSGVQTGTEQYPATTELVIERLAARVDYRVDDHFNEDITGTFPGTITIEGAALVNRFTKGTWLFKRVADDPEATTGFSYLGDETETNWVVDAAPEKSQEDFENYYPHLSLEGEGNSWFASLSQGTSVTDVDGHSWYRIGYPLENTNRITRKEDLYTRATGVVFKANFQPTTVIDQTGNAVTPVQGTTFYRYAGKLYKDYAALCALNPGFPATEPSFDELKATYGTDTFVNGICYYTWWIKHNEDGDNDAFGPMEYAIVRNNLYQLTVKSVGELGDPEPGPTSLIVEVMVKPWTVLPEEEVNLKPPRVD